MADQIKYVDGESLPCINGPLHGLMRKVSVLPFVPLPNDGFQWRGHNYKRDDAQRAWVYVEGKDASNG